MTGVTSHTGLYPQTLKATPLLQLLLDAVHFELRLMYGLYVALLIFGYRPRPSKEGTTGIFSRRRRDLY